MLFFFSLFHPFKVSIVATTFMERIQKLHGVPKIIVSDRDPIFTGNLWTDFFLVWVLNWLIAHLTTLNMMGKLRLSINL
jgi:hypothetical protein